jgi:hypothetical protein
LHDNIINVNKSYHHEREGYAVSLESGNFENDLQAAQDSASFDQQCDPLMSVSVSTDVNGNRQNPDLRLVDSLLDVVSDREK